MYSECRSVLLTEDENRSFENLPHAPDLRDVAKIVDGCSSLPKEAAENKKLFTRLWVHETLRYFYDRYQLLVLITILIIVFLFFRLTTFELLLLFITTLQVNTGARNGRSIQLYQRMCQVYL